MSDSPYESWPLDEPSAKVLGLPSIALTPTAQRVANGTQWLWFDLAPVVAIGQGPAWPHSFPAASLAEALERVWQRLVG